MSGISLLAPLYCFSAGGYLCQCQYETPDNISKTSRDPLTNFYAQPSQLFSPGEPSIPAVLVSPTATKEVWCICVDEFQLGAIAVCKLPTQTNVTIMPTHIGPVYVGKAVQLSSLGFSQEEISRTSRVSHDVTIKVLRHVHEKSSLTQGLHGQLLKPIKSKQNHALFRIIRWKSFHSASMIRLDLIRRYWRHVFVHMIKRHLVAAGYHAWHSGQYPRLNPGYCCCPHLLADRPQSWNHQHWSHAIFDDESRSRSSLYHSGLCAWNQHNEKLGYADYTRSGPISLRNVH